MGCGASLSSNGVVTNGKRTPKPNSVVLASTFKPDNKPPARVSTRRLRPPSFLQFRRIFRTSPSSDLLSTTRRRRQRTEDCRFIEQRIYCESGGGEVDDAATNTTVSTTITCISPSTSSGPPEPQLTRPVNQQHPRSFFRIAADYNRLIDELKNHRPRKAESPQIPFKQESQITALQEAAILHHTSRQDFLQSTRNIPTPPPPFLRRGFSPTRISIYDSRDTLSENSFVVVHNTLKVAWEKEFYAESIPEVNKRGRLRNRRHSLDSSTASGESYVSADQVDANRNSRLVGWTQKSQEIETLDWIDDRNKRSTYS